MAETNDPVLAKPPSEMSDQELEAYHVVIQARRRAREKAEEEQRRQERQERYQRIDRELHAKYTAEAGVTPEEFERLDDIFYRYYEEREQLL